MENIAGSIEKIFFSNDSIVMGVLRLDKPYIIKELRRTVHDMRFKATIPSATLGINVKMDGECVIDPKWGPQFIASKSEISLDTKEDIYNFLSSGFINGVGPALAQRIIKKFGNDTKSIIEKEWHRLEEVSGISEHKAANIHQSYLDSRQFLELVVYGYTADGDLLIADINSEEPVGIISIEEKCARRLNNEGIISIEKWFEFRSVGHSSYKWAKIAFIFDGDGIGDESSVPETADENIDENESEESREAAEPEVTTVPEDTTTPQETTASVSEQESKPEETTAPEESDETDEPEESDETEEAVPSETDTPESLNKEPCKCQ